jgi:hypothetical protein
MSWFLFIDEPGDHQLTSPYGLLSGIAVEDQQVWTLARKLRDAQEQYFGAQLITADGSYLTAETMLGEEVGGIGTELVEFRNLMTRSPLAATRLFESEDAADTGAIAEAMVDYCDFALGLAKDFGAAAFAMFFPVDAITVQLGTQLRKDYAFLFERYYHYVSTAKNPSIGILVMPRNAREQTYVSHQAMIDYATKTTNGRIRSQIIVPNPLYVDGYLSIVHQLVDIFSHVSRWSVRLQNMSADSRSDMSSLAARCMDLRFSYKSENGKKDWSFKYIDELRLASSVNDAKRFHRS